VKKVTMGMFKTLFMAAAAVLISATILIVHQFPLSKTYAQMAVMATKTKKVTLIADAQKVIW
jgi:hypothetical protein